MSEYRRSRGGGGNDNVESRERSIINTEDEDAYARARDRSGGREDKHSRRSRSWTPERSGSRRRHQQSDESESDTERRSNIFKAKELEIEKEGGYRDDRSKGGRESSWFDRNRDHESGSKDNWKKRRLNNSGNDKEATYGEFDFDHEKNWESQRRERNERIEIRPGYRRNNRTDGGFSKTSSDTIEIQPKFHDDGRDESGSSFAVRKNNEVARQTDFTPVATDEQWGYPSEERTRMAYGPGDETQDKYRDDGDLSSGRNNIDMQGDEEKERECQKGFPRFNRSSSVGPSSGSGSQQPIGNNQGSGSFSRGPPQGAKANRLGRGGRGRVTGRDGQRVGHPLPMMIPPFSPLGMPPPMQPLGPNMSPAPVPPMGLGVFIPPFQGPNVWPGARGIDMNMLAVPPGLSPVQPGPSPSTFSPNMGAGPNPAMYFNQPGPARGMGMMTPNMPGPGFNSMGTIGRGMPHDKAPGGWTPRNNGPPGKAPSRGEQNDYSQNFVDTGARPQNFIRELELTSVVEDYPKLRELIQKKDEIVAKSATPPMYYKCDLRKFDLSPEFFGTKFDVILVDPPWEEYVHRAPGVADHMEYWTFDDIINLKIEAIADTPSFIFLWVGDGIGLEQGRLCLKKWGFRRCEDICWVKTNRTNATTGLQHDAQTLFQHSKEHCLMGIKGTVRRSTDGHIIHANIDTDIIIAEEPPYGSTTKPEDMYRIIEHFSLGRRRLELFGEDHNIRSGWLTVGKGLSSSNFNVDAYIRNFADKDGKVWQGGGGRNPPPDAPHLVLTTPDIEGLRPKSPPPKNQQQQQQQQQSTPLNTTAIPGNRRPAANSPQNHTVIIPTQEASLNSSTLTQWTGGLKPPDILNVSSAFGQ